MYNCIYGIYILLCYDLRLWYKIINYLDPGRGLLSPLDEWANIAHLLSDHDIYYPLILYMEQHDKESVAKISKNALMVCAYKGNLRRSPYV